jgi:nucleotide-binding universal stress UspA family protein
VHAFAWPALHVAVGPGPDGPLDSGLRHDAQTLLAQAEQAAREVGPQLRLTTHLTIGFPVPVLLEAASRAELIVMGGRGLGALTGLFIGSVTAQVAAQSPVPVLVSKGLADDSGPVVAGVDSSPWAPLVLESAHAEAHWRAVELHSVTCLPRAQEDQPGEMVPAPLDARSGPDRLPVKELQDLGERYPDVRVRAELLRRDPAHVLTELSEDAQLMVVGSRGLGEISGLVLGSVSQHVLHHAKCPVLIVPHKA